MAFIRTTLSSCLFLVTKTSSSLPSSCRSFHMTATRFHAIKKAAGRKRLAGDQKPLEAVAYCSSDKYDLHAAKSVLQPVYSVNSIPDADDALVIDFRDIGGKAFVFDVGAVVFWNVNPDQRIELMSQISHNASKVSNLDQIESESLDFTIDSEIKKSRVGPKGNIQLKAGPDPLDQYSISHAMSLSVKLATYESNLESFADSMQYIAESMASGQKLNLTRTEVFRKIGHLFKLRHEINLGVDLLDIPDFYWDREELEVLFKNTCATLAMSRRTRLMNERLNYCYELMELLTSHLDQEHNTKLEWMIIWLIAVEVVFEVIHFMERYGGGGH